MTEVLVFSGNNGTLGQEPYMVDLDGNGVSLIKDLNPGGGSSFASMARRSTVASSSAQ